ncbi:MAG: Fpg/Nei family DNA glycosylase [Verrucomicrobia bacterium]|nr:Fpg/Nei family DNA glycosylase [Verrucomicrobiota bacterium]
MPELAEVLYFSRRWDAGMGRAVTVVHANKKSRVFRGCDVAALKMGLAGAKLKTSRTHGKQMLFEFSGGCWLAVHLGMTGELTAKAEPHEPGKHDHLVLHTKSLALVFTDPRQFGALRFCQGKTPPAWWRALPPQPMDDDFTPERVREILRRHTRQPLKALLLDQRYFPGVGNWMADEIMWQMKLPPHTVARSLVDIQVRKLWRTVRKVCAVALKTIGVDWSDPPRSWLFKYRWARGHDCPRCGTKLVYETLRGRTACWCPVCQKSSKASRC